MTYIHILWWKLTKQLRRDIERVCITQTKTHSTVTSNEYQGRLKRCPLVLLTVVPASGRMPSTFLDTMTTIVSGLIPRQFGGYILRGADDDISGSPDFACAPLAKKPLYPQQFSVGSGSTELDSLCSSAQQASTLAL